MKAPLSYTWEPKALLYMWVIGILCFAFASCYAPKTYTVYAYQYHKDTTGQFDVYNLTPLWSKSTSQTLQDSGIIVGVKEEKP